MLVPETVEEYIIKSKAQTKPNLDSTDFDLDEDFYDYGDESGCKCNQYIVWYLNSLLEDEEECTESDGDSGRGENWLQLQIFFANYNYVTTPLYTCCHLCTVWCKLM